MTTPLLFMELIILCNSVLVDGFLCDNVNHIRSSTSINYNNQTIVNLMNSQTILWSRNYVWDSQRMFQTNSHKSCSFNNSFWPYLSIVNLQCFLKYLRKIKLLLKLTIKILINMLCNWLLSHAFYRRIRNLSFIYII